MNNIEKAIEKLTWVMKDPSHRMISDRISVYPIAISALEHQLNNGWIPVETGVLPSESHYYEVTVRERIIGVKPFTTTLYYNKDKNMWFDPEDWEEKHEYNNHLLAWKENTEPFIP